MPVIVPVSAPVEKIRKLGFFLPYEPAVCRLVVLDFVGGARARCDYPLAADTDIGNTN